MKKATILTAMGALLLMAACTKKASPSSSTTENKSEVNIVKTAPADNKAQMADGEKLYVARCGRCHELPQPGQYTAAEWPGIMRSMAPKAKLNESMKEMVMAYVTANAKKG